MDYAKSHGRQVAELMSDRVVFANEHTSLSEIATLLERHRIKRIPIVKEGKLIGIVSRSNLVQALAAGPAVVPETGRSDCATRLDILDRLANQPWTGFGERNIVVADGVVHFWGLVARPEERKALLALVDSVPGVRKVLDEMIPAY
jgi:CBS-domain-containing membrane protein